MTSSVFFLYVFGNEIYRVYYKVKNMLCCYVCKSERRYGTEDVFISIYICKKGNINKSHVHTALTTSKTFIPKSVSPVPYPQPALHLHHILATLSRPHSRE